MPVLLKDITIKTYTQKTTTTKKIDIIEATLLLKNHCQKPGEILDNIKKIPENIEQELKKSILNYIYGELIAPFNRLICICKRNAENNKDFNEIDQLTKKISNVLHGNRQIPNQQSNQQSNQQTKEK